MAPTNEPWTDDRLALHWLHLAALDDLQQADLPAARAWYPHWTMTDWVISPARLGIWRRRFHQIQKLPQDEYWVTRLVVLRNTSEVVGGAGFHGAPDERGMVEIGYGIDPARQRKGYGAAVIQIMLREARKDPTVRVVRASVGMANAVSRAMVVRAGFHKVGEEMDEEDGLEDVYELELYPGDEATAVSPPS